MILNPLAIAAILAAAFTMIFFSYMSRNNERSEQAKARRIAKLRERVRKLNGVIEGLPSEFLPSTLKELAYISIIDSLRQTHALTGNENIRAQIENVRQAMAQITAKSPAADSTSKHQATLIEIKECKYLLKDLYALIVELHSEGLLKKPLAESHLANVRAQLLKVSLATYKVAANNALETGNLGLALHYCETASTTLAREPSMQGLDEERSYFKGQVTSLEQRVRLEEQQKSGMGANNQADEAVLAQWQALESSEDEWKKKRY